MTVFVTGMLLSACSGSDDAAISHSGIALIGATVLDGTGAPAISNGTIVIDDDRIICVGTTDDCPTGNARRIDVNGKWITPGLVDAHVHFMQTGWHDGRPDGIDGTELYPHQEVTDRLRGNPDIWHRAYLCSGITAVYDVGGHQWTLQLGEAAENHSERAHVRAAGPLITHAGRDILNGPEFVTFMPMSDAGEGRESVRKVKGWGSTAAKVWYLQPPEERQAVLDDALMAVGDEARKEGIPLIVHATTLREAKLAISAGAELLVHAVFADDIDEEFVQMVVENDVIITPTMLVGPNWTRSIASVILNTPNTADDPNNCVDVDTRNKIADTEAYAAFLGEWATEESAHERLAEIPVLMERLKRDLVRLHEAGATIATGTDAGNPLTLHGPSIYAEMEAMQDAGIPAADIVVMSTRNGARAMGRLDDFGTLEAGKIANLIVLGGDPSEDVSNFRQIEQVMRAGALRPVSDFDSAL